MNRPRRTSRPRWSALFCAAGAIAGSLACGAPAPAGVLDPSNPNLVLWLKADAIAGLSDGQSVATWLDSSGKGNHVSEAVNQPTYVAGSSSGLAGPPVVRFDGVNDRLANAALNPAMPLTVFGVVRHSGGTFVQGWLGGGNGRVAFGTYVGASIVPNASFWAWAPNQNSTYGLAGSLNTGWNVHAYTIPDLTETNWSWHYNGIRTGAAGLTAGNPQPYANGVFVGWSGSSTEFWNGDVAEIVVFQSALTTGERNAVNNYLSQKYGLSPLVAPVAVPLASGPAFPQGGVPGGPPNPQYAADKAIDGDLSTFSVLLDDTLTGGNPSSIPPNGAAPATGHMIFDLGEVYRVTGSKLFGRLDTGSPYNPRNVDFFYFADDNPFNNAVPDAVGADPDIILLTNHEFPGLGSGASQSVYWGEVFARYIGMRVNSSYEQTGPTHFNYQIGEMEFYAAAVPEPSALALAAAACAGLPVLVRRRKAASRF